MRQDRCNRDATLDEILFVFTQNLARGEPSSLPFEHYLVAAHTHNIRKLQSAPDKAYLTPLWEFARAMKGHPRTADCSPDEALQEVETAFAGWVAFSSMPDASHGRRTKYTDVDAVWMEFFGRKHEESGVEPVASPEDARVEFLNTLEVARIAPGVSPPQCALRQAEKTPLELPQRMQRSKDFIRFVSLAGWLQVIMGDRPIALPCDLIGGLLGVTGVSVSRYRKWATSFELLTVVKEHRFAGKPGAGEGTSFRFEISRFPVLSERPYSG